MNRRPYCYVPLPARKPERLTALRGLLAVLFGSVLGCAFIWLLWKAGAP